MSWYLKLVKFKDGHLDMSSQQGSEGRHAPMQGLQGQHAPVGRHAPLDDTSKQSWHDHWDEFMTCYHAFEEISGFMMMAPGGSGQALKEFPQDGQRLDAIDFLDHHYLLDMTRDFIKTLYGMCRRLDPDRGTCRLMLEDVEEDAIKNWNNVLVSTLTEWCSLDIASVVRSYACTVDVCIRALQVFSTLDRGVSKYSFFKPDCKKRRPGDNPHAIGAQDIILINQVVDKMLEVTEWFSRRELDAKRMGYEYMPEEMVPFNAYDCDGTYPVTMKLRMSVKYLRNCLIKR